MEDIVKRAFYLAWCAAGSPAGETPTSNPFTQEDDVWDVLFKRNGYAAGGQIFGRHVGLELTYTPLAIVPPLEAPAEPEQGWVDSYPTYQALIDAATASVG